MRDVLVDCPKDFIVLGCGGTFDITGGTFECMTFRMYQSRPDRSFPFIAKGSAAHLVYCVPADSAMASLNEEIISQLYDYHGY